MKCHLIVLLNNTANDELDKLICRIPFHYCMHVCIRATVLIKPGLHINFVNCKHFISENVSIVRLSSLRTIMFSLFCFFLAK